MQTLLPTSSESTRIEVNVSEFARGEIAVKLRRDHTLLVHALHLDQYAVDNFFRKELVKTFPLPSGADVDKIRSVIRNTGILTIDIPMLRDIDAVRRSHDELLKAINPQAKELKADYNRSASHADMTHYQQQHGTTRPPPLTVPKRTGSLGDIGHRQHASIPSSFNIAEFLQSQFHPTFTPNGKKLILKVDTRGYEPDELTVRLLDNNLLVQGRKKLVGTMKKQDQKQFSQSIRLPDGIDKLNVTSQVMDDGVLVVDVPLLNSVI
jgi:HSP20 family molecular chaperone IbpA